jgi:hypothetical protein
MKLESAPQPYLTPKQTLALWHRLHIKFNREGELGKRITPETEPKTFREKVNAIEQRIYLSLCKQLDWQLIKQ